MNSDLVTVAASCECEQFAAIARNGDMLTVILCDEHEMDVYEFDYYELAAINFYEESLFDIALKFAEVKREKKQSHEIQGGHE